MRVSYTISAIAFALVGLVLVLIARFVHSAFDVYLKSDFLGLAMILIGIFFLELARDAKSDK
jgi:hypothetical protein